MERVIGCNKWDKGGWAITARGFHNVLVFVLATKMKESENG